MKKIAIRGGHNYLAVGAKALLDEVTEDRKIYPYVIKYLKLAGYEVLDVTPGNMDSDSDLSYGVNKANAWGADLFASVHLNKAYNSYTGALGTEVYVYSTNDKYNDEVYAKRVVDKIASLGFKNRGVKVNPQLYELKNTKMNAMIVECFFLEATDDVALYKKVGPEAIGKAIAEGIVGKTISAPQSTSTTELYRVRKSWEDSKSQIGAFSKLDNAIEVAKSNTGYKVFDSKGKQVYPQVSNSTSSEMYRVRKSWADAKTQVGAFTKLDNAKEVANAHANEGYKVFDSNGNVVYTPSLSSQVESPQTKPQETPQEEPTQETPQEKPQVKIMGESVISANKMAKLLLEKNPEPKISIEALEFAKIFLEEGAIEGVRGDIAFCQAMHETGWLKFGNQVLPEQHNYAGIGATNDSGVGKGAWFSNEREGIRAQIQHLKAYASKEALVNPCVDPRFNLVTRGIAPNWTDLNGRWAVPGLVYGETILVVYNNLLSMDEPVEEVPSDSMSTLIKNLGQVIAEFISKLVKLMFKGEDK